MTWPFLLHIKEGSHLFLAIFISLPPKVPLRFVTIGDSIAVCLIFQIHVNPLYFRQYFDQFWNTRILTGWPPESLEPQNPSRLQTSRQPSFCTPCCPWSRPNWWPCNTSSCYIKLMTLTRNLLLSLVSKWLSPGLQKIFDLIFSKMSLSTLLFHLGVNPNLLYNGSTSASMYLKRINI